MKDLSRSPAVAMAGLSTDTISELTSAAGVTVDGVLLKDSAVNVDTISEATSAAGVTVDGVLLKDSGVSASGTSAFTGRVTTTDGVASGDARVIGGVVHTKITSTTVENTTTETTIGSHTLPASTIKASTTVRVRGAVRVTNHNGTPTVTLKLKLGATEILAPTALSMITADRAIFEAEITGRAAPGASASVEATGTVIATQSGTAASVPVVNAPANYATNGTLAVTATAQWSAAHANNSLTCEQFTVDVVG